LISRTIALRAWLQSLRFESQVVARELSASPAWRKVGLLLLPYIGVLVGLDVAAHYGEVTAAHMPAQFFLSQDHGFGEFLEYALTGSAAVLLFILWRRTGAVAYLANAVLFTWLTADNVVEFHEAFGHWVAPLLPVPDGSPVRANDIGEAMVFAAVGGLWLAGLWSSLRASQARAAIHALILAGCVAGAAFFGVAVDMAVVWGEHTLQAKEFQTWLEDGGEFAMICLSFFVAVATFDTEKRRWEHRPRLGENSEALPA
jgi:hypothetical protein